MRFFIAALFLLHTGCSLPKIIVLHDPLSADEHVKLGNIYESQEKSTQALEQFRAAVQADPKHVQAWLLLGELAYKQGAYPEAETAYQKATKLQPDNGDINNNLAWVYIQQRKKLEKAEALTARAMTLTPEHKPYYLDTRGVILLRSGRVQEAIAVLREAVETLPEDKPEFIAEAYGHLAEAYQAEGDVAQYADAEKMRNELLKETRK